MREVAVEMYAGVSQISYPSGARADAIEQEVAKSLPKVNGLDQAATQEERIALLRSVALEQRNAFIRLHGDPFGCDEPITELHHSNSHGIPQVGLTSGFASLTS